MQGSENDRHHNTEAQVPSSTRRYRTLKEDRRVMRRELQNTVDARELSNNEELTIANNQLQLKMTQAVVEQMPAAVLVAEAPSGKLLLSNRQSAALFGHSFPPPIDTHWTGAYVDFKGFHANGQAYQPDEWPLARSLATGESIIDEEIEFERNGARGTLTINAAPIRNHAGEVIAAVATCWEISERKRTAQALRDSEERFRLLVESARVVAENASRAKDEFVAVVSHELRTPLHVISLWSSMLASDKVPKQKWAEGFQTINRAVQAQQQLIEDLLDISRMAMGKLRLTMSETSLTEAIEGAIQATLPAATARGIAIETTFADNIGLVRADSTRLQQVLWNLLNNAIKFTPVGGNVRVQLRCANRGFQIEVTDSGIGIDPKFLSQVFDRFRQADVSATTRQHAGLGLGLTISKQLIEMHNGTITVTSEGEGRGATFIVWLPQEIQVGNATEAKPEHKEPANKDIPRAAKHRSGLSGVDILLVEDEAASRDAARRLLEMHGARVRAVESAVLAREAFALCRPDVVVSDIAMPGEDGYALLKAIRAIEREHEAAHVPALALTAFARDTDRYKALDAGFDAYLSKPTDANELLAAISKLTKMET
ncbi:MAG: response regulator [Gammaproteobacteria bacterium]|nr:response regulator [Gammaproteobacteria bacterium]